ncbi:MAG TPA: S41 family peptidase, partial [Chitinophagaceae bacterium]|nr:S41 family peptidase [Chitinophagaceae bacterium]
IFSSFHLRDITYINGNLLHNIYSNLHPLYIMRHERKESKAWFPILFALVLITGMYAGFRLRDTAQQGQGLLNTGKRSPVQQILDLIRLKYVDSINTDTLADVAIKDILSQLDPHSVYIPPVEVPEVMEDLQGNFQGIGIEFHIYKDTVNVINVLENGPGYKAGLKTGDQFIKIDDSVIAGKKLAADQVKGMLKGAGNTSVTVTVKRENKLLKFTIKRGTIPLPSIDIAYMIDKQTGFIRINKFAGNTYQEFMKNLEDLQAKGMQKLILDLRQNGGGVLSEAINIADEFLDEDKLIVFTKGNHVPTEKYQCKRPGLFEKGKLVVLIDESSASASEVLTGALQDWDRATIIGRRSFGKGLVQEQYELSNEGALRLTVARYYTPSGRSIQRPYDEGKDDYYDDITKRIEHGDMLNADSNKITNGKAYKTHNGRTVYSGGGIMPDIFVPYDTSLTSRQVGDMFSLKGMNNFLYSYYLKNKKDFEGYKSATDFVERFPVDHTWQAFLKSVNVDIVKSFPPEQLEADKIYLKALLARIAWRAEGFYQVINQSDNMVQKALEEIR